MNELSIYSLLSDVDEDIIESTIPPSLSGAPAPRHGESFISRFLSSGWVAATLSVLAALGILVAIVKLGPGDDPYAPPAGTVDESTDTAAAAEESSTDPATFTESDGEFFTESEEETFAATLDEGESYIESTPDLDPAKSVAIIRDGASDYVICEGKGTDTHEVALMLYKLLSRETEAELPIVSLLADESAPHIRLVQTEDTSFIFRITVEDRQNLVIEASDFEGFLDAVNHLLTETVHDASMIVPNRYIYTQMPADPSATPAPFVVRVANGVAGAAKIAVHYQAREPGVDITDLGRMTLVRLTPQSLTPEQNIPLAEPDFPAIIAASDKASYANGTIDIAPGDAASFPSGDYRLTVTTQDGTTATANFRLELPLPEPSEKQPFRFSFSITAPDGFLPGKYIQIRTFAQNISDETFSFTGASFPRAGQIYIYSDGRNGNPPHVWKIGRIATEDVTDNGIAPGEIVAESFSVQIPVDAQVGSYNLLVCYHRNGGYQARFEDVFFVSSATTATPQPTYDYPLLLRNEQNAYTYISPIDVPRTSSDEHTPVEELRKYQPDLEAISHIPMSAGTISDVLTMDDGEIVSLRLFDLSFREIAVGDSIDVLNECRADTPYYVDVVYRFRAYLEDGSGNYIELDRECLFPFLRHESPNPYTNGLTYTQSEDEGEYTVTEFDASKADAEGKVVIPSSAGYGARPITALANRLFAESSVAEVTIPRSVTTIGYAFSDAESITRIRYLGTVAQWNAVDKPADWASGASHLAGIICFDGIVPVL